MKIWILFFLLFNAGCGTEVGNPLTDNLSNTDEDDNNGTPSGDDSASFTTSAAQIKNVACKKLVECYGTYFDQDSCENNISGVDGFDTSFGLDSFDYADFSEIEEAEGNDEIEANSTYTTQCVSDIEALSCSDSEVINAFDSSNSSDFSNTYEVIPTRSGSCNDLYE